jgi:hypothetical protein
MIGMKRMVVVGVTRSRVNSLLLPRVMRKSIIEAFNNSSWAYARARLSLIKSVNWVEGIISLIDDEYYKELMKGKCGSQKG